jgi:hypothetical protein
LRPFSPATSWAHHRCPHHSQRVWKMKILILLVLGIATPAEGKQHPLFNRPIVKEKVRKSVVREEKWAQ